MTRGLIMGRRFWFMARRFLPAAIAQRGETGRRPALCNRGAMGSAPAVALGQLDDKSVPSPVLRSAGSPAMGADQLPGDGGAGPVPRPGRAGEGWNSFSAPGVAAPALSSPPGSRSSRVPSPLPASPSWPDRVRWRPPGPRSDQIGDDRKSDPGRLRSPAPAGPRCRGGASPASGKVRATSSTSSAKG
jgi:hypothetical protein